MDNWKPWMVALHMLEDGQIWEGKDIIAQIERHDNTYRIVFFKMNTGQLHYVTAAEYNSEERLMNFLSKMGMKPTSKVLCLRRPE